jgi:hypothetical protein
MSQSKIIDLRARNLKALKRMNDKCFMNHHEQRNDDQISQEANKAERKNPFWRQINTPSAETHNHMKRSLRIPSSVLSGVYPPDKLP